MIDLDIIETDDLMLEILKRYDQVVFVARKMVSDRNDALDIRLRGDPFACAGLAGWAKWKIMQSYDACSECEDDEGCELDDDD